jgi:hypothetical protein
MRSRPSNGVQTTRRVGDSEGKVGDSEMVLYWCLTPSQCALETLKARKTRTREHNSICNWLKAAHPTIYSLGLAGDNRRQVCCHKEPSTGDQYVEMRQPKLGVQANSPLHHLPRQKISPRSLCYFASNDKTTDTLAIIFFLSKRSHGFEMHPE